MVAMQKDPEKEERILAAAMKVIGERGLDKGTIAEIAKYAGIGKGTVYQYFTSKDEIFRALLVNFFNEMLSGWKQMLILELPPQEKLRLILESGFDMFDELDKPGMKEAFPVLLEIMLYGFREKMKGGQHFDLGDTIRDIFEIIHPLMEEGVEKKIFRKGSPEFLSFILFASLDGIGIHYYLQQEHFDLKTMKKETTEFFLNAILEDKNMKT